MIHHVKQYYFLLSKSPPLPSLERHAEDMRLPRKHVNLAPFCNSLDGRQLPQQHYHYSQQQETTST